MTRWTVKPGLTSDHTTCLLFDGDTAVAVFVGPAAEKNARLAASVHELDANYKAMTDKYVKLFNRVAATVDAAR